MISAGPVVALLLALHTCYREPRDEARLRMVGESIAAVSDTHGDAAALCAIAYHESALCRDVHSGERKGGHGVGLWQIEPGSRRVPPFAGLSREHTEHAAGQALWLWRRTAYCRTLAERFGAYAGLGCKPWPGAHPRVQLYRYSLQRFTK